MPDPPKLIEDRLDAVEAQLDQADHLILKQARASAAQAFQSAKPLQLKPLIDSLTRGGTLLEGLRGEISQYPAAVLGATERFRLQADAWIENLPAQVVDKFRDGESDLGTSESPDLQLPSPHTELDYAATAVSEKLPKLLAQQYEAIDQLAAKVASLRSRLEG